MLLTRMRAGDGAAFETLLERHDGSLRRVARSFVHTTTAVEEVVQETWLGVVGGVGRFEGRSSLKTWIFRILVNRAQTRAVRDARSVPFSALENDDAPTVDPTPSAGTAAGAARRPGSRRTPRGGCSAPSCAAACSARSTSYPINSEPS